jgi:hypothetical protein
MFKVPGPTRQYPKVAAKAAMKTNDGEVVIKAMASRSTATRNASELLGKR